MRRILEQLLMNILMNSFKTEISIKTLIAIRNLRIN
jgi:hypothetical protein